MTNLNKLKKANHWDKEKLLKEMGSKAASELIWQAFRDGEWAVFQEGSGKMREEFSALREYTEAASAEDLVAAAAVMLRDYGMHLADGFSENAEDLMVLALERDAKKARAAAAKLDAKGKAQFSIAEARAGKKDALSDETMQALAQGYLNLNSPIWEEHWFNKHGKILSMKRLAEAAVAFARAAKYPPHLRDMPILDTVLAELGPADQAFLLCLVDGPRTPVMERVRKLKDPAKHLEAAAKAFGGNKESWPLTNATYYRMALLVEAKKDVPPALDADLGYFYGREPDHDLDRAVFGALPAKRAAALVQKALGSNGHLLAVIDDEALLTEAIGKLGSTPRLATGIGDVGARALEALEKATKGKPDAKLAAAAAGALGRIPEAQACELLVKLLGHSSKVVREAATNALGVQGERATASLEAGTKAKKKAIREICADLLARMEATAGAEDSPLGQAEAAYEKLSAKEKARYATIEWGDWQKRRNLIDELAKAHGLAVAMVGFRDGFLEHYVKRSYEAQEVINILTLSLDKTPDEDRIPLAYVVFDTLARLPKLKRYNVNDFKKSLKRQFGPWAAGAAAFALLRHKTSLAEPLTLVAAKDPKQSKAALVQGLGESAKGLRTTCVEALRQLAGDEALADQVIPLLKEKKKNVREAAAQVLAGVGHAKAKKALEAALKKEKSDDVAVALEDALRACAGGAEAAAPDAAAAPTAEAKGKSGSKAKPGKAKAAKKKGAGRSAAEWNAELTSGRKAKLPKWLQADALPELELAAGGTLDEEARAALVGKLKKEHERNDPLAWELATELTPASRAAFGRALFAAWQGPGKGKSSDKWALYQMAAFGSEDWIHELAPRLDGLSSMGKHAYAGWVIEVLGQMGKAGPDEAAAKVARDWVGHWADHALTSGLQKKSRAALGDLAKAAGVTEKVLRSQLNGFVAAEQADKKIPTLDFDAHGRRTFSYGKRKMTVLLGSDGKLSVQDDAGKITKTMPKPRKDDDAALAKKAKDVFKQLQQSSKRTLGTAIRRCEAGMIAGRTWTKEFFEAMFVAHPLMGTVGTGLVFLTQDGTTLRVSEERTLMNADGDEVTLKADAVLRIAHPLDLDAATLAAWKEHLGDADVVQPFEQVHRPTFPKADKIDLPETAMNPNAYMGKVRDAGWNRGYAEDAGIVYFDWMRMPARGVNVELHHTGYYVGGDQSWMDEFKVQSVSFTSLTGEYLHAKDVDPVAFSEVQLTVQRLFGKSPKQVSTPEEKAVATKTDSSGNKQRALVKMGAGYPGASLAPSSRAKCMHCDEKIMKGDVRIVIEREIETPRFTGKGPGYMHPKCAEAWVEAAGLDLDDFAEQVRANAECPKGDIPAPFGG